jgi:hypothetical protein
MKYQKALIIGIILVLMAACSSHPRTGLDPTVEQLNDRGYYVYILPDEYQTDLDWTQAIHIHSFDIHCRNPVSGFFNPVRVIYKDANGTTVLTIGIAPYYALWDHGITTTTIPLLLGWIPDKAGEYYLAGEGTVTLKLQDMLGMDVVMFSILELDQLVEVINWLEYVGPDIDSVGNPWIKVCEQD